MIIFTPWESEFNLIGTGTVVNVFLRDFVYLPFFALGAAHLLAPCCFTEDTHRTSLIRHLRREMREFPLSGILSILKLRPRVYDVLVARERESFPTFRCTLSVHHRKTQLFWIGGKITNRLRYWNIDGMST